VPEPVTNVGVSFLRSLLIIPNGKTIRNRRKKRRKRKGERNQCETSKPKEGGYIK
jgi:hypothetical protein